MEQDTIKKLSFPDSVRLSNELSKKHKSMLDIMRDTGLCGVDVIGKVNDVLYELAKKSGRSLYDICFTTEPVIGPAEFDYSRFKETGECNCAYNIILKPIMFDFEHDGGYWKNKYFELKKQMRELIDKNEK